MTPSRVIAVVSHPADARWLPEGMAVTADRYLEGGPATTRPGTVVVNLCRTWRYGSKGYYVSLIADARGQKAVPTAEARAFGDWLSSGAGKDIIGGYTIAGNLVFEPWPAGRPADRPERP